MIDADPFSPAWNFWDCVEVDLVALRQQYGVPALAPPLRRHMTIAVTEDYAAGAVTPAVRWWAVF